jgi:hypothetical protein
VLGILIPPNRVQIFNTIYVSNDKCNGIDGVMVSVLASVDLGFEPPSGQTKDYQIGI